MKRVAYIIVLVVFASLVGMAQDNAPVRLKFDRSAINPSLTMPEMPARTMPATNIKPTFNTKLPATTNLKLDMQQTKLADTLQAYNQDYSPAASRQWADQQHTFDVNPYSKEWSSSGIITHVGNGYLTGAGGYSVFPGMGNMASGNVALVMPVGERLTVSTGVSGHKYHLDRNAWNDYGVFANASYRLTDRLSLNAFGQYYANQRFHSPAAMAYMASSSYGGTLGMKVSDNFSVAVGARRIYDPYRGKWLTLPVVEPTLNVFGQPISFDAGPLIYQLLHQLFNGNNYGSGSYDFDPREVRVGPNVNVDPGYNPNSPVRIPDVFRH